MEEEISVRARLGRKITSYLGLGSSTYASDNSMFSVSYIRLAKVKLWIEKMRSLANNYSLKLEEANRAAKDLSDHLLSIFADPAEPTYESNNEQLKKEELSAREASSDFQQKCHEMYFGFGATLVAGIRGGILDQLNEWTKHFEDLSISIEEYEKAHRSFDYHNQQIECLTSKLSSGASAEDPKDMDLNEQLSREYEELAEVNRRYLTATKTSCQAMDHFVSECRVRVLDMLTKLAQGSRLYFSHGQMLMGDFLDQVGSTPLDAFAVTPSMGMQRPKLMEGRVYRRGRLLAHPMYARILGNRLELFQSNEVMDTGQLPTVSCDVSKTSVTRVAQQLAQWDWYGLCKGAVLVSGPAQQISLGFSGMNEMDQWYKALLISKSWDPNKALVETSAKFAKLTQFIQSTALSEQNSRMHEESEEFYDTVEQLSPNSQRPSGFVHDLVEIIQSFETPESSDDEMTMIKSSEDNGKTERLRISSNTSEGSEINDEIYQGLMHVLDGHEGHFATSPLRSSVFEELLQMSGKTERLDFNDLIKWDELKDVLKTGVLSRNDIHDMWSKATSESYQQNTSNGSDTNDLAMTNRTGGFREFSEFLVLFIERQIKLEIEMALDDIDQNNFQSHRIRKSNTDDERKIT